MTNTRIRVYQYGLLAPTSNGAAVDEQFRLARKFRNELVHIERSRRAVVGQVTAAELKLRSSALKKLYASASGVAWNTKGIVSAAAEQSFGSSREPPKFVAARFVDRDRIGGQIVAGSGIPAEDLQGPKGPARIEGDHHKYKTLVLDISAPYTPKGQRVIARWPMKMHRPLPEGSVVKGLVVTRRKEGPFVRWTCEITVAEPALHGIAPAADSVAAIDVGWRKQPDGGILAATVGSSSGSFEAVVLPREVILGIEKADSIRAIRDRLLNDTLAEIKAAMTGCDSVGMHWVRKPEGMRRRLEIWGRARVSGDSVGYEIARRWAARDLHLWQYETGMRRTAIRRRKDIFRNLASRLTSTHAVVVIEDFDKAQIASKNKGARSNAGRVKAAPSALTTCFPDAVQVDCRYSSRECHQCYSVGDIGSAKTHTCVGCGATWDRDQNACLNLIERYRASQTQGTARAPKKRESKWSRVTRESAERRGEDGTARDPSANAAE